MRQVPKADIDIPDVIELLYLVCCVSPCQGKVVVMVPDPPL